jgi:transposase
MHYLIKDTEFGQIMKYLLQVKGIHKKNPQKLRLFIEAVCYACRSGCQWRFLPTYYGNWRAIHKRFMQWSKRGLWKQLFEYAKIDPDNEYTMIDATIVRAHPCAAGYGKNSQEHEALGRSRGGFTTKIHATVDGLGNPLNIILTPGQHSDISQAKALSENITDTAVIADKAYDCDDYIAYLTNRNCDAVIPPKSNRLNPRDYDKDIYKERHAIECFFNKIKHFRRVFSRFEKTAQSFLSIVYFVGALIWFR